MKKMTAVFLVLILLSGCSGRPLKLISFYSPGQKTVSLNQIQDPKIDLEQPAPKNSLAAAIRIYDDRICWMSYYFSYQDTWEYANKISAFSSMEDIQHLLGMPFDTHTTLHLHNHINLMYLIDDQGATTQDLSAAESVVQIKAIDNVLRGVKMFNLCYDERKAFSFTHKPTGITISYSDTLDEITKKFEEAREVKYGGFDANWYTLPENGLEIMATGQFVSQIFCDESWNCDWDTELVERADQHYQNGKGSYYLEAYDHNGEPMSQDFAPGHTSFLSVVMLSDHSIMSRLFSTDEPMLS